MVVGTCKPALRGLKQEDHLQCEACQVSLDYRVKTIQTPRAGVSVVESLPASGKALGPIPALRKGKKGESWSSFQGPAFWLLGSCAPGILN